MVSATILIIRALRPLNRRDMMPASALIILMVWLIPSTCTLAAPPLNVSLSYDDALTSQLDNAVPLLDKHDIRASFYLVPANPGFKERKDDWKKVADTGHELGNHSFTHPCRGSLAQREWVASDNDLDKISALDMLKQVRLANEFLTMLDGKERRTYTPPCGDRLAKGENYLDLLGSEVAAIKAYELPAEMEVTWAPQDVSAEQLIEFVQNQPDEVRIVNLIFHGIGGDYLSVSSEAHAQFLQFLADHPELYNVDTYLAIRDRLKGASKLADGNGKASANTP